MHYSAPQILVEKIKGTLPGKCSSGFVIPGRRIIVEAMIRADVNVPGVGHVIGLERRLISRPTVGDARIQRSIVKKQRRLDLGDVLSVGLTAVKRYRSP